MNREIKFRALKDDMSNCNYVYGRLIYDTDGVTPRIQDGNNFSFITCIKGTESQYTGLKDKNGVEIYEGDIVVKYDEDWDIMKEWADDDARWHDKTKWPIIESNRDFVTLERFRYWLNSEAFGYEGEDLQLSIDYEVISNIHENPELLS